MKRERLLVLSTIVLSMCLVWFVGCEKTAKTAAVPEKEIAARVGNEVITLKDVDARISKMPVQYQAVIKSHKKEVLNDMVLETLLYGEAQKRGIDKDKEVKEMLAEAQKRIAIAKLLKDEVEEKAAVSDAEAQEYYNAHKDEFTIPERMKASQILVKTEDEAKAVLDELGKGKSFEDLAKEKSIDTSAKKGGDLGYFTKGQMIPEFEQAAAKLEIGQTSGIVKTQFGYHVIKLADKKPAQPQEFKDVSARIKTQLLANKKRDVFNKLVDGLKAKANVKINEAALGETEAAPVVMQPASMVKKPMPALNTQAASTATKVVPIVKKPAPVVKKEEKK